MTLPNSTYLLLLGPPGSGKGTQASIICEALGLVHVSSGDLVTAADRIDEELFNYELIDQNEHDTHADPQGSLSLFCDFLFFSLGKDHANATQNDHKDGDGSH